MTNDLTWKPIATAPRDPFELPEVIVGYDQAAVWIVRSAFYRDGTEWEMEGFPSQEAARGWWSYANSVSQEKLEGFDEPTHWLCLVNEPGDAEKAA